LLNYFNFIVLTPMFGSGSSLSRNILSGSAWSTTRINICHLLKQTLEI